MSLSICLAGCDSSNAPVAVSASDISQPVPINLYPVATTQENPARLFMFVTGVGSAGVNLPVAFDTGSSGVTLNAQKIFPPTMVSPTGFIFAPNQTSLTYSGITVTNQQGYRTYGGATGKTELGNIGYASITFGDAAGTLTTSEIPIFFYFAVTENTGGALAAPQTQQGWFGVNDTGNLITVAGTNAPGGGYPACSPVSFGSCVVGSPLKYLSYSNNLDAGFSLSPAVLQACDVAAEGSCTPAASLTIGLTPTAISGYHEAPLDCALTSSQYSGPQQINNLNVCGDAIAPTTVAVTGTDVGSIQTEALFDTGTPFFQVNVPTPQTFPSTLAAGDVLHLTLPNGFAYQSTVAATGVNSVDVAGVTTNVASIIGLQYFTTNYFLIDYATGQQGWK